MANYPDNSYSARETREQKESDQKERKLEKVVTGNTKARKKSDARKFVSFFVPEDTDNVKSYILMDVIIPGIKNAIADVVSIILFGESGRLGSSGKSGGSRISRQKYWNNDRDSRRSDERVTANVGYEYDDILFDSRGDADLVLEQLESCIDQYGIVSVGDLYDLAGITTRNFTANKYGWTDIRTAKVVRVRDGYILQLPRTVQIT